VNLKKKKKRKEKGLGISVKKALCLGREKSALLDYLLHSLLIPLKK